MGEMGREENMSECFFRNFIFIKNLVDLTTTVLIHTAEGFAWRFSSVNTCLFIRHVYSMNVSMDIYFITFNLLSTMIFS
jgi:hypothetical protein